MCRPTQYLILEAYLNLRNCHVRCLHQTISVICNKLRYFRVVQKEQCVGEQPDPGGDGGGRFQRGTATSNGESAPGFWTSH